MKYLEYYKEINNEENVEDTKVDIEYFKEQRPINVRKVKKHDH